MYIHGTYIYIYLQHIYPSICNACMIPRGCSSHKWPWGPASPSCGVYLVVSWQNFLKLQKFKLHQIERCWDPPNFDDEESVLPTVSIMSVSAPPYCDRELWSAPSGLPRALVVAEETEDESGTFFTKAESGLMEMAEIGRWTVKNPSFCG